MPTNNVLQQLPLLERLEHACRRLMQLQHGPRSGPKLWPECPAKKAGAAAREHGRLAYAHMAMRAWLSCKGPKLRPEALNQKYGFLDSESLSAWHC